MRLRVDASRCDGQGVCTLVAPEFFTLDRYGYALVRREAATFAREEAARFALAREAEATCPRAAIILERLRALAPPAAPGLAEPMPRVGTGAAPGPSDATPHLLVPDTPAEWRAAGGFRRRPPGELMAELERAALRGQGGARFPAVLKWGALGADAVLVVNGAEREPGTIKDAHLLHHRPHLVLDGALSVAHDRGITRVLVAVPEGEAALADALTGARSELTQLGVLASPEAGGPAVETVAVPRAYVGGEETALLAAIQGGAAKPRLRPPFPAERGLHGRPTLVHNAETLADIALINAHGGDWWRASGTELDPGIGLFSVGRLGGPTVLHERPFGYPVGTLLDEAGLAGPVAAILVGGYAGGLLNPDQRATPLAEGALTDCGARLGTKSILVVPPGSCVLRALIEIMRFFARETAVQCPPCHRGLPDMVALLERIEAGLAQPSDRSEFETFMSTLRGRGLCALPDGAANVALSYVENLAEELEAHMAGRCPEAP